MIGKEGVCPCVGSLLWLLGFSSFLFNGFDSLLGGDRGR